MQLYEQIKTPGGRVIYRPYTPPECEPEVKNFSDGQLITIAGALGVTLLCLYERHFPPHKRVARKVKAVENAILDLFHGNGEPIDTDMADWVCRNWDLAMLIGEFGYDSAEVRARVGQGPFC